MKKRLAIYPFFEDLMPILRHKNKIQNYDLIHAIIPKGWETFDESEKQYMEYFCTEENFYSENYIDSIDAILLCIPVFQIDMSVYNRITNLAEKSRKQIIYVSELEQMMTELNIEPRMCLGPELESIAQKSELSIIDVPVAMILGFGENCEKWDLQLGLYDYFTQKGYKVSLISSNPISQLMGFHTFPNLDSTDLTFSQQVKSMNSFIKNIELEERPHLIILGVPGGILKYSQTIPNGYGYLPFLISNAVVPDVSILSLFCGNYEDEYIKKIQSTCFYRFGITINYFHISKKVCNYNIETKQLNYYSLNHSYLIDNIIRTQENISAFNILDTYSTENAFKKIRYELQNNIASI